MSFRSTFSVLLLSIAASGLGQCSLHLTSAKAYGTDMQSAPVLGDDDYVVKATWVTEGQARPFKVKFQVANKPFECDAPGNPGHYSAYVKISMPLDGPIPFKVTLDPENVSNNSDPEEATYSGSFTPTPPKTAIEYYDPKTVQAQQSFEATINGGVRAFAMFLGQPSTEGNQSILQYIAPENATTVSAGPFGQLVSRVRWGAMDGGTVSATQTISAQVSNCRLNVDKITDTWSSLRSLSPDLLAYTQPDTTIQSDDPAIVSFVQQSLPADFATKLSPIQAARILFQAVERQLKYQEPSASSAAEVLAVGKGDCNGMSKLYLACLRQIGIPGRLASGWLKGSDKWHVWSEMYLPSAGWIPQDVTFGEAEAPDGSFAYYFGCMPKFNERIRVSLATVYVTPESVWNDGVQKGWTHAWWQGPTPYITTVAHCSLSN